VPAYQNTAFFVIQSSIAEVCKFKAIIDKKNAREKYMDEKSKILASQIKAGRLEESGSFPKVVLLDTVSSCNLRCSMCVHKDMTRKQGIMKWELLTKILDEIATVQKDTRIWMVFFGDPFVIKNAKPSIFDMIKYAKSIGLTDVVLNSNGCLMDETSAKKLIDSGLDSIYFGIDAATPETYAKLRVGGDYAETVNNVLTLIRLVKEQSSSHPKIFVQFVEMDENSAEKDAFVEFWSKQGVTVKIRPKVSWAGSIDAPNLVLGNQDRWPCHWLMQTMAIADDGRVVLCPVDLNANVVVGDATKNTLAEIWQQQLKELRSLHLTGRYSELPPMCRDCRDWQSARSDYHKCAEFADSPGNLTCSPWKKWLAPFITVGQMTLGIIVTVL
jgi:radical SAM protein with 4Fe4S-binding SPASM domain